MFINEIIVQNFKSFDYLKVGFKGLNILIGGNATGKSNFIKIFEFLRNIANHELDNAISMEGGVEYLTNAKLGTSKNLYIKVSYRSDVNFMSPTENVKFGTKIKQSSYEFEIQFNKRGKGYHIIKDNLILEYQFVEIERKKDAVEEKESLGTGITTFSVKDGKIIVDSDFSNAPIKQDELVPAFFSSGIALPSKNMLLLETPFFGLAHRFTNPLGDISIYDFDPKQSRKAVSITGKAELEEDASNLSFVLKNIIEDKEEKRRYLNLVADLLPFIEDMQVQKFADKSLLFTLKEKYYSGSAYLPAPFISDGTVNLTALLIPLYFENKSLVIIEEPERNLHPHLISRLMNMLEEVSKKKQIILTTHNPEIVKHANLESLFLVSRDKDGFSVITKPSESNEVQTFLNNEIGIDELYIQDLLGVAQ